MQLLVLVLQVRAWNRRRADLASANQQLSETDRFHDHDFSDVAQTISAGLDSA